jgi:hypothetical protein
VIIELGLCGDQSRQINHLAARQGFGEGQPASSGNRQVCWCKIQWLGWHGAPVIGMRVLVIEDDRKAAELLVMGLREKGIVVDVASTGEAGGEMAGVNTYGVIVLDWLLPDKDGIFVCRDLRCEGSRRRS